MGKSKTDRRAMGVLLWLVVNLVLALVTTSLLDTKTVQAGWPGSNFTLTVEVSPADGGMVKINEATVSSGSSTLSFISGVSVQLEAVPVSGYRFKCWSGSISENINPITFVMTCNKTVTAEFSGMACLLNIEIEGKGSINPSGSQTYVRDAEVSITATPDPGWRFNGWTGDVADRHSATTVIIMNTDKTIIANFSEIKTDWWLFGSLAMTVVIAAIVWVAARACNTKSNKGLM